MVMVTLFQKTFDLIISVPLPGDKKWDEKIYTLKTTTTTTTKFNSPLIKIVSF